METNIIYNEDCRETMKRIQDSSIDLTITSPPYDKLRDYTSECYWTWATFTDVAYELFRITKQGGIIVWVVGDETRNFCESLSSFKQAIFFVENCGFNLLDTMIYEKIGGPSPYPNMKRYSPWFEYMFVFSKGKPTTFNPIKDKLTKSGENILNSGNTARQKNGNTKNTGSYTTKKYTMRHNVWKYHVGKGKDTKDKIALKHPARFPEALAKDCILSWSNPKDIVYDPLMGSGTTAKMAMVTDRNYIGSEVSKEYYDLAIARLGLFIKVTNA